ncbi:M24 family metallopeptidase [Deinococcus antarcticus]|uniref:M24 family metallopeptidase n=1 Tax=Deinococcus antarcticus TaxID=1298767 RepID=A0ABV8AAR1_9DEIO
MTNPTLQMQAALQHTDLDGWLVYDFQGLNPHARTVLGIPEGVFLTRRFFVYVPREGQPVVLHNHIEGGNWRTITADWGAALRPFGSHAELDAVLGDVVRGQRVAMEYSPDGAVPYVSRVDAGTLERVRRAGAKEIVSSANLLQGFLKWTPEDYASHERAVKVLMQAKDDAFKLIHERLQSGQPVTELDAQAVIMGQIEAAGMSAGHPVNVSFGVNAADSHYEPGGDRNATLEAGQCVLIDLWAQEPGRPFADVTWVGHAGSPSDEYQSAWTAVRAGRNAAIVLMNERFKAEGWGNLQGWEVDRRVRDTIGEPWATFFLHRTGHDLGVRIHGAGANLDDYETRDTRVLTEGLCVTVEPGTYPAARGFGIRSEVDVYLSPEGPRVTTHIQREPFILGGPESWDEVRARGYGQ